MLRSAISAFTRVFDALWPCGVVRCWAGVHSGRWVPALRSSVTRYTASGTRNVGYSSKNVTVSATPARVVR
jgi:hypothetical protein